MNTFQLSCFLSVAKHLNFALASEERNISQPAISHQIQSLETELGYKLFHRTTRSVSLTQEGILFIEDAKQILHLSMTAKNRFKSTAQPNIQLFSMGGEYTPLFNILDSYFNTLHKEIPSLRLRISLLFAPYLARSLEEGSLDAFLGFNINKHQKKHFQYKEIISSDVCCVCVKEHKFSSKKTISLSQLENEHLVLCAPNICPPKLASFQMQLINDRPRWEYSFCDFPEAITTFLKSGYGVGVFPSILIHKNEDLIQIPIENSPVLSVGLYYKSSNNSPILKRLLTLIDEHNKI